MKVDIILEKRVNITHIVTHGLLGFGICNDISMLQWGPRYDKVYYVN